MTAGGGLVHNSKAIQKVQPWLKIQEGGVARPSTVLGTKYNQASTIIFQGVNEILRGTNAKSVLPGMQQQLQALVR